MNDKGDKEEMGRNDKDYVRGGEGDEGKEGGGGPCDSWGGEKEGVGTDARFSDGEGRGTDEELRRGSKGGLV